ncbi:MAG: ostA-like family protein [Rhodospirillales bacterium]|nr:ostA-like family protein [Rhodospirillales bacterium]MCB9996117.1 ostA-like family protein [Rhodospirillales bacterium]
MVLTLLTTYLLSLTPPALAQQSLNPSSDEPLEITADQTLEWHRDKQQYIAHGNVIAKQGTVSIMADRLSADYRETDASSFDIYRLTATGNVKIVSQGNTAYGEHAVYEVERGMAVMTGNNLRLASPDQSVTARERFEYWVTEGRLSAVGDAHVVRAQDTLDADSVSVIFKNDASGQRRIDTLTADGNVKITTPTETLTGTKGRYTAATNIAEITGNVKISRGPNVLEGQRAEVNLSTNVSKMHGGAGDTGRVRGVFYPGSENSN